MSAAQTWGLFTEQRCQRMQLVLPQSNDGSLLKHAILFPLVLGVQIPSIEKVVGQVVAGPPHRVFQFHVASVISFFPAKLKSGTDSSNADGQSARSNLTRLWTRHSRYT